MVPQELTWDADLANRRGALLAEYSAKPLWAFKDPRCLITLPFWREALPDVRFIGTFRSPAAVVHSLLARPGMVPQTSPLKLWIEYNKRLLTLCQTEPVPLLCFDWDQATYQAALETVHAEFGLRVTKDAPAFYETDLINALDQYTPEDRDAPADLQEEATRLYQDLQALTIQVPPYDQSEVPASRVSVP